MAFLLKASSNVSHMGLLCLIGVLYIVFLLLLYKCGTLPIVRIRDAHYDVAYIIQSIQTHMQCGTTWTVIGCSMSYSRDDNLSIPIGRLNELEYRLYLSSMNLFNDFLRLIF